MMWVAGRFFFFLILLANGPVWAQAESEEFPGYALHLESNEGLTISDGELIATNGQAYVAEGVAVLPGLDAKLAGRPLALYWHESLPRDRYDRPRIQILGATWVQRDWLSEGQTFLLHGAASPDVTARLRRAERAARRARRGLWAEDLPICHYRTNAAIGQVAVVQGPVRDVGVANSQTFLNFGADRRRDFTVRIEHRDRRSFGGREGLEALEGRLIEVRGYLYRWGGAMMDLYRSVDLEILEDGSEFRLERCAR